MTFPFLLYCSPPLKYRVDSICNAMITNLKIMARSTNQTYWKKISFFALLGFLVKKPIIRYPAIAATAIYAGKQLKQMITW